MCSVIEWWDVFTVKWKMEFHRATINKRFYYKAVFQIQVSLTQFRYITSTSNSSRHMIATRNKLYDRRTKWYFNSFYKDLCIMGWLNATSKSEILSEVFNCSAFFPKYLAFEGGFPMYLSIGRLNIYQLM